MKKWWRGLIRRRKYQQAEIYPDEIFLDSSNLPRFDNNQFEGRFEKPLAGRSVYLVGLIFILVALVFTSKLWVLQVNKGEAYAKISANNHLRNQLIFNERGVIYDRNGQELAWNELDQEITLSEDSLEATETDEVSLPDPALADQSNEDAFSLRRYTELPGLAHLLGYVKYPAKDKYGFYYQTSLDGKSGVEADYNSVLAGENGLKISEIDALNNVLSESAVKLPVDGDSLTLSVDAEIQSKLYEYIVDTARERGFGGGAGVIMDVETGDLLAMTSYPEFDSNRITTGKDNVYISSLFTDRSNPLLNRVIGGLYTPGSIIKIFMAFSALEEKVIDPNKSILSTGEIRLPNPYFPDQDSVFVDWKAHGQVDMRRALAVSSNVYFYEIGGGFENQKGLGIARIEKYMNELGFGAGTGIDLTGEVSGVIPSPEWKAENFDGEIWRVGDTYHTAIGQYGFQITPIQAVRSVAMIANEGRLFKPKVVLSDPVEAKSISISNGSNFKIVKEGMRLAVTEGTAQGLSTPAVKIAAKTGTAELGFAKQDVNSWVVGFFPSDRPKYAFAVVMEKGPRNNLIGATSVMRRLVDYMAVYTPQYFE